MKIQPMLDDWICPRGKRFKLRPRPWVFDGKGARDLPDKDGRWTVSEAPGGKLLFTHVPSGLSAVIPSECVCGFVRPNLLLVDCQMILLADRITLQRLPRGYWRDELDLSGAQRKDQRPCVLQEEPVETL